MTYLITGIFSAISLSFDYRMLAASEKSKDIFLVSLVSLEFGMFLAIRRVLWLMKNDWIYLMQEK